MQVNVNEYTDTVVRYTSEYGLKIVAALAIFFIGKIIIKRLTRLIVSLMNKANVDSTLVKFLNSVIYFAFLIVVVLAALSTLGVDTTSFLAVFGAASLAIGLALKDSLSNIGAAILIIVFRPFRVGDVVDAAGGASGTIQEINLFSTIIATADNKTTVIPNSTVIGANITNYSSKPTRRVTHTIVVNYENDIKLVKEALLEVIKNDERILSEPSALVAINELSQNGVNFTFRVWVNTLQYWDVYFDTLEKIKLIFDERGISIAHTQLDTTKKV